MAFVWKVVFFLSILQRSQSVDDAHEDLAKFGYKPNMKVELFHLYFWVHIWTMCKNLEIFLKFWLNYFLIENLKKNLILALSIFIIAFRLYIGNQKKASESTN
jgi:hypothetical protein